MVEEIITYLGVQGYLYNLEPTRVYICKGMIVNAPIIYSFGCLKIKT